MLISCFFFYYIKIPPEFVFAQSLTKVVQYTAGTQNVLIGWWSHVTDAQALPHSSQSHVFTVLFWINAGQNDISSAFMTEFHETAERQHLGMCRRDEGEQELDVSSAARFTKLEKTSFNPTGTVVRPFLCQFSPSHWFKHPLSSCSSSMQRRAFLSFLCSLVSFLCVIHPTKNPRQHVVYVNDPPFMLKVEWDLSNITHTYARTHILLRGL